MTRESDDRVKIALRGPMIDSPPPRTAPQRMLLALGSIGPLGYLPASGTATVAVVGLPLYALGWRWTAWTQVLVAVILAVTAVAVHDVGDRILGEKDSRKLVWDEVVGFWIAVLGVPFTWQLAAAAFLLERALDVAKFPPAGWIERRWPGGWGVVGDDVVAGLYTCGLLHLMVEFCPGLMGVSP